MRRCWRRFDSLFFYERGYFFMKGGYVEDCYYPDTAKVNVKVLVNQDVAQPDHFFYGQILGVQHEMFWIICSMLRLLLRESAVVCPDIGNFP